MTTTSKQALKPLAFAAVLTATFVLQFGGLALAGHVAGHTLNVEPETGVTEINMAHTLTASISGLDGAASERVDFEFLGPNDLDGDTPTTPDQTCTVTPSGDDPTVGSCEISYSGSSTGTDSILAWIDDDDDDSTVDADQTEGPDESTTPGGTAEVDDTDVVQKTWQDSPECNDGQDNDGDGDTDFPDDLGCTSSNDNSEADPSLPTCPGFASDTRNQVVGGSGSNNLTGTHGRDIICGLGGSDTIRGLGGNDLLLGGSGRDWLSGGRDNDRMRGGPERDEASFEDAPHGVKVSLATGTSIGSGRDRLSGVENVTGSNEGDRLTGNSQGNLLRGLGGRDHLQGKNGSDTLLGGSARDVVDFSSAGNRMRINLAKGTARGQGRDRLGGIEDVVASRFGDSLAGSSAKNKLTGKSGHDRIAGGRGGDVLDGGSKADFLRSGDGRDLVRGGKGKDTISFAGGSGVTVNLSRGRSSGQGPDRISGVENAIGSAGSDILRGSSKRNRLVGGEGRDRLYGLAKADVLRGGGGRDKLFGGDGDDTLSGGPNIDTCHQGPGSGGKASCEFPKPPPSGGGGGGGGGGGNCDPSYPDFCIPPPPPDLDCPDISRTDFRVVGDDPHGFDGDDDGVGCES